MKLVACPKCHAQYDAGQATGPSISCRCGATFSSEPPRARDVAVTRCAACGALVGERERVCTYCHAEVIRRPAPSGPVCPSCYAQNPESARFCVSCGVAFLAQPVRATTQSLPCPVCAGAMLAPRSLGGIWVEECRSCLGLWAPGEVIDRLVDRIRERLETSAASASPVHRERRSRWQPEFTYRKCPECGVLMQRRNFGRRSGVVVDWCASHGTWLDANELEDVASFVIEGGLRPEPDGGRDSLAANPQRVAAAAAAETILARERLLAEQRERPLNLGDLFTLLLRQRF